MPCAPSPAWRASTRSMPCSWPGMCSTTTMSSARRWPRRWRRCASSTARGCCCRATTIRPWRPACGRGSPAMGRPSRSRLATSPEPLPMADGMAVVLPAPLTERHSQDDLTAWIDQRSDAGGCGADRARARCDRRSAAGRRRCLEPDRRRPGRAGAARLSGAWRLARDAPDHGPDLVRGHARARSLQGERRRARCCWWRSTGRTRRPASPPLRPATIAGAR